MVRIRPAANNHMQKNYSCVRDNFTFDNVFPSSTNQIEVYSTCVSPLVLSCVEGFNATCIAYGQTSSGITYTLMGNTGVDS